MKSTCRQLLETVCKHGRWTVVEPSVDYAARSWPDARRAFVMACAMAMARTREAGV